MNRRTRLIGAAVLAAAALTAAALTVGGVVAQAGDDTLEPGQIISALDTARTGHDALPSTLVLSDLGDGGVVGSSSRLIATDSGRSFWVARDVADDICLVVALGDKGQTIAAACNRPAVVEEKGLLLGFQGFASDEAVAYLLPDAAILDDIASPWRVLSDNVVVALSAQVDGHGTSLPTTDHDSIALIP
jgi:predicted small secreted protein